MAYRSREDCEREAERLGIDWKEMSWPELQRAVSNALKLEEMGVEAKTPAKEPAKKPRRKKELIDDYIGTTIYLAPELLPERYRLLKYDEDLGPDYDVMERHFDIGDNDQVYDSSGQMDDHRTQIDQFHDYTTGTYRLKKRSDRRVTALSSVPKENAGMYFRPGMDYATVVTWKGRAGYLWNHFKYPNVKELLIESGYYQEYKDRFVNEPNVWYAAGKMLVCDVNLVHQIFKEIEEKEAKRRDIDRARRKSLGMDV